MVVTDVQNWDRQQDVIVIGSGTGMAAALGASEEGADVLVLEKAPKIGGTTAVSGGVSWVGNSHPVVESVGETPTEDIVEYLYQVAGGRTSRDRLRHFLETGPEVYEYLEAETPLSFVHVDGMSDYYSDIPGAHEAGRGIEPDLYDGDRLGEALADVRESPQSPIPVKYSEMEEAGGANVYATRADYEMIAERMEKNLLSGGRALVAGLYEAALDRDIAFEMNAPAEDLVVENGTVVGVVATIDGEKTTIEATGGVVIAAGGLEWDDEMATNFLRGPMESPMSPPYNEGDGIEMGTEAGAKLANMNEAWWNTAVEVPGEKWEDGNNVARVASGRYLPGAILVNDAGERFGNESAPYNDLGKRFHDFDTTTRSYENLPAYQIMDHDFRESYAMAGTVLPGDELPDWIAVADTLEELAEIIDVDAEGLQETVEQFNEHAADGEDPEYHSGEKAYDRHMGDPDADHPNLAPLTEAPFYAYEIKIGAMGTKGGLVTTADAEVVNNHDDPIPGLYASSNSAAHLMGTGYSGGGATIGPNVVYGFIAGKNAANRVKQN